MSFFRRENWAWIAACVAVSVIDLSAAAIYFYPARPEPQILANHDMGGAVLSEVLSSAVTGGKNSTFNKSAKVLSLGKHVQTALRPVSPPPPMNAIRAAGDALSALPNGDIVFEAPSEMKVGEKRQVDTNVGINVPIEVLRGKIRPSDQQIQKQGKIAKDMAVTLNGSAFEITPITPEQQPMAEGYATVWSWYVTAKVAGEQQLEAVLYAIIKVGDSPSRQRVKSVDQKITVKVHEQKTVWEWVESVPIDFNALKNVTDNFETIQKIFAGAGLVSTTLLGWFGIARLRAKKEEKAAGTPSTE